MIKKFTFIDEDHTIGALLRKDILKNEDIEFAAYKKVHPLIRKVELTIVDDKPDDVLENSIKNVQKDIKKLRKGWEKVLLN